MIKKIKHILAIKIKDKEPDWFEWLGINLTPKQKLIEECQKYGVSSRC